VVTDQTDPDAARATGQVTVPGPVDLLTTGRGVPGCTMKPACSRAIVQLCGGRAVATPDLHVADKMMDLVGEPTRLGDRAGIADLVVSVRRLPVRVKSLLDQFNAGW
jgi:hypothetical protein